MIEQRPVDSLTPHPRNSRTHAPEQIAALGRAIREWGFTQPLVVDEGGTVLVGHGRLAAAKAIGMADVPVLVRSGLTDAQKRALLISDNRLAEMGSRWDDDVLNDELRFLLGEEFDLTLTGFDLPEQQEQVVDGNNIGAESEPITKPGDIWRLGKHRLACAAPSGGPLEASLLVTAWRPGEDAKAARQALYAALQGNATVAYLWHDPEDALAAEEALITAGFGIRSQIVMTAPEGRAVKGRYLRYHDPCWYAVRKGKAAGWLGGRSQSTVWAVEDRGRSLPADCWRRPILNRLATGGVVLDPMAGSGTGLIAAHQTARIFSGCEADPVAVDRAVTRWEAFTGQDAHVERAGAASS